jgi:hypothetical protein
MAFSMAEERGARVSKVENAGSGAREGDVEAFCGEGDCLAECGGPGDEVGHGHG